MWLSSAMDKQGISLRPRSRRTTGTWGCRIRTNQLW